MPRNTCRRVLAALMLANCGSLHAQILGDAAPVVRPLESVQFGVPGDAKYVFCEAHRCPDRTIKTLAAPTLTAPSKLTVQSAPQPLPRVQSVLLPPPELSPAKAIEPTPKAVKKKPQRRKRAPKLDCRPVAAR